MTPAETRRAAADARREAALEAAAVRRSGRNLPVEPSHAVRARHSVVAETRSPLPVKEAGDAVADRATQDRVHAWYQSHGLAMPSPVTSPSTPPLEKPAKAVHAAGPVIVAESDSDADTNDHAPAPIVRGTPPAAKPKTEAHADPAPDLSPVAHKATVADFDRALQLKTQSLRAAAVEAQAHTTADDDAAVASTQIPGTAPTERVALPFTHGDLLTASATSADFQPRQATLITPKSENPDKHLNKHTDADVLANSADALNATDGKRPNVRAIAEQTAMAPTQKLQLPKPVAIAHGSTPAVSAVNAAVKMQQVDPQTVAGLTDETFDDNSDPVTTARSAVTMAARSFKTDPKLSPVGDGDDDAMRATTSTVKVNLYDDRGKLMMIPAMKGTHEILVHQNQMAVSDGLDRIEDDNQLLDMRRYKLLVALPDNEALEVDDRLPPNRRYARPWSVRFLNDLSRAHYARFGTPLIVTSAARTVEFQKRLVRINGNAAPPTGDVASPHLYGQAVDIAKHGMNVTEIAWMRAYLTPVETEGKIDVEEEFQQSCFHISIYRRYLGLPGRKQTTPADPLPERTLQQAKTSPEPAQKHRRLPTAMLATGLR